MALRISTSGHGYGRIKDTVDNRDHMFLAKKRLVGQLPMTYTYWKHKGVEVWDQGALGSCTGHGWADLVKFALINNYEQKITNDLFIPSRLFIYYYERLLERSIGSDSGAQIRDGVKALAKFGVPPEDLWPYDINMFAVQPSARAVAAALQFEALVYQRIDVPGLQGDDLKAAMVSALIEGYPIVFGFDVYNNFEDTTNGEMNSGDIDLPDFSNSTLLGGHCCVIRGYDPGRPYRLGGKDYFFCKNSWGVEWGDQGHFRIAADYLTNPNLASDMWILKEIL